MQKISSGSVTVFFPEFSREELVDRLRGFMPALQDALPVRRAVLFGSWAKGRATAFSDIDLMVIYDDPPREDAFKLVRTAVPMLGIEPHIYTEAEAASLRKTLDAMTKDGVELL